MSRIRRFPVDDVDLEQLLQVALLGGGQRIVEHHHVDVARPGEVGQLGGLALADEEGGVERVALDQFGVDRIGSGRVDQQGQFGERSLGFVDARRRRRQPPPAALAGAVPGDR